MHNSRVGLHLRLHTSASAVARTAKALQLKFFQFFLQYEDPRPFLLSTEDEKTFLSMRSSFDRMYVHGSYRFDIAASRAERNSHMFALLEQEIRLAKRIQATHYILHPGTFEVGIDHNDMLGRVIRTFNTLLLKYPELVFCIENTANPLKLLGAKLEDLVYIQERIDIPERFGFCIDTAHAHAAGYALDTVGGRYTFFGLLRKYKLPILLVHLNDTQEQCGSRIDRHAELGKGIIGINALHDFVSHELIRGIPLLVESPELSFEMMRELLNKIKEW